MRHGRDADAVVQIHRGVRKRWLGRSCGAMRCALYEDPVLSVLSWRDESEAIALAKATEYDLTASILTNNVRSVQRRASGQVRLCLDQRRFGPLLRRTFRRLQEQPGAYLNTGDRMPFGVVGRTLVAPATAIGRKGAEGPKT